MRRFLLSIFMLTVVVTGCETVADPLQPEPTPAFSVGDAVTAYPGTVESLGLVRAPLFDGSLDKFEGAERDFESGTSPASMNIATGGINPVVQETGKVTLSIDGTNSGSLQVDKPAGATVRGAYVAAAANWGQTPQPNGSVKIGGVAVPAWEQVVDIAGGQPANHWVEVTSIVKPMVDAAAAGIVNLSYSTTSRIEGTVLAVIFDDPSQTTDNTVALLFGGQKLTGDNFYLALQDPIDKSDPGLVMDMSVAISFGYQAGSYGGQYSLIDVNGTRLTTSAGGQDDGFLITVGGVGDTNANPVPATSFCGNGPRCDDELYSLVPLLADGAQQIDVFTKNPSNDDNLFFAAFFLTVAGQVATANPLAKAGSDQQVESPNTFDLDGSASFDSDGTIVSYTWTEGGVTIGNAATITGLSRAIGFHTFVLNVVDNDGLTGTDQITVEVTAPSDATPPAVSYALSGDLGSNGWYVGPVTIEWTVADAESAVTATAGCETVTTSLDGSGYAFTCSATSAGGTAEVESAPFMIDQTAPELTSVLDGTVGNNDWYVSPVTVTWTSSDDGSGLATTCEAETESNDSPGSLFSCTVTDLAGNETSAVSAEFMIDQTAPALSHVLDGTVGDNDWYVSPVTVTWTSSDDGSGLADSCADATESNDGTDYSFSCTVTDLAGNETAETTADFMIDQTIPTVTYSSYDGVYDVSDMINITCAAADAESGVASDSCADVVGDAWTFVLGSSTYSADATDNAGNAGSGSTSFDVSVSYDGLCTLVERFVTQKGVANSLCVKLRAAARSEARGNTKARDGSLGAFINEVEAQSGKKVPADKTAILIALAQALM